MNENLILAKLRVLPGQRAIVLSPPDSYRPVLAAFPAEVDLAEELTGAFDFIHLFATESAEVVHRMQEIKAAMKPKALLWVSYPKGAAIPTDLKRDSLRDVVEAFGLKAVAQVAIDDVWSALRFKLL